MSPKESAAIKAQLGELARQEAPLRQREASSPELRAFMALAPSNAGRVVAAAFNLLGRDGKSDDVQVALAKRFMESAELLSLGDLTEVEAMYLNQAQALQVAFASLMHSASVATKAERHDALLQLALRAQSNCRATLAALVDLKFPRQTVIARQANVNNGGQQQVNNGGAPAGESNAPHTSGAAAPLPAALPPTEPPLVVPVKAPATRAAARARARKPAL